jgi:hypothetical protein
MSSESEYPHHATLGELNASAEQGCGICSLVVLKMFIKFQLAEHRSGPVKIKYLSNWKKMCWSCAGHHVKVHMADFIICTDSGIVRSNL